MLTFELPLLDAAAAPRDAFAAMADAGTCGLAILVETEVRLLHFDAIENAFERGTGQLSDIRQFEKAALVPADTPGPAATRAIEAAGFVFGMIGTYDMARLVSLSESRAGLYLTSPPVAKCGWQPPHYYPPHKRDPKDPYHCQVDGTDLP